MSLSSFCLASTAIADAWVAPNFCAYNVPVPIDQARSVRSVGPSDFIALERGSQSVVYFHDTDNDGLADDRHVLATADALNHGIAIHEGYLYASSSTHVYRWPLATTEVTTTTVTRTMIDFLASPLTDEPEIVIDNINADGQGGAPFGHTTRTLAFDYQGRLYVSVGSMGNIDPDAFRSRIRRFDSVKNTSLFPIDFLTGLVFADGLRNEVGLAFDQHGDLWGVENSADQLKRDDLGGDALTEDNPAEELNRFKEEDIGKDWGYPFCWTEFQAPEGGLGLGAIWAWPSFLESGQATDEQCRENTVPPVMPLQGHSAPLGITFYKYQPLEERPSSCPPNVAFPPEMDGYAFIAYHGSWNRIVPTGYKVVYVEMDANGNPIGDQPKDLLMHEPPRATWDDGFRPVDVSFDDCGRLLVSSDGSWNINNYGGSRIVRMEYTGGSGGSGSGSGTELTIPAQLVLTFSDGTGGDLSGTNLDYLMGQTVAFFDDVLLNNPDFKSILLDVTVDDVMTEYDAVNNPDEILVTYTVHVNVGSSAAVTNHTAVVALAGSDWNYYMSQYMRGGVLDSVREVWFHFTGN